MAAVHPDIDPASGSPQRLHPATLLQRFLLSLPALAVLLLPALRGPDARSWLSIASVALYGAVVIPLIVLQYRRFRYTITEREIVIQRGVFTLRHRSIPIERIQNIEIEQSLLPRLLHTAKVKIETAGSSTTEGVLEYVSLREAQRIRSVVRAYQRGETVTGPRMKAGPGSRAPETAAATPEPGSAPRAPGAAPHESGAVHKPDAAPHERWPAPAEAADLSPEPAVPGEGPGEQLLFTMDLSRVLLSGVFRFSLLYIALIFTAIEYLGVNPEELVDWFTRDRLQWLTALTGSSPWMVAVTTGLVVLVLAWFTGIAVNLSRYYGFRLWLADGKLHRRHGLLTLSEGTVPLKKVQALIVRTNPLMSAFGWFTLEVQMMGIDQEQRGQQVVVPLAREQDLLTVARHILPFSMPEHFEQVSRLTIRRSFLRYIGMLALVISGLDLFWEPALWGFVAAPLLLVFAYLRYRYHGYALDDSAFYVRRGVFHRRTWVLPARRFQAFYLTSSIFQRRLGLRSLYVDTAGAGPLTYPIVVDMPGEKAEATLQQVASRFTSTFSPN